MSTTKQNLLKTSKPVSRQAERNPMRLRAQDEELIRKDIEEEARLGNIHSAMRLEFLEKERQLVDVFARLREKRQSLLQTLAKQYDIPEQGWMLDLQTMTWQPNPNVQQPPKVEREEG